MQNDANAEGESGYPKERNKNGPLANRIIIVGVSLLGIVILALVARFLPDMKERMRFFTDTSLGWLVFVVVAVQTYFSTKQWDAMTEALEIERAKTNPRLRIAEVTAENFDDGKRPVFIVTIANDGLIAATGVRIHMSIEIDAEKPMDWIHDQVVTISASGREHYFIHSSFRLTPEQMDNFDNAGVALRVVGFFEYGPIGITNFCYKYVPMQGEYRPAKIPQFVPCDFTPRLNTTLLAEPGHLTLTGNAVILTHGQVVPKGTEEKR